MKCKTFTNLAEMVYSVSKKIFLYIILMVITSVVFSQNVYVVTKTTDPNPFTDKFDNDDNLCDPDMYGTLQWAINKVNYNGGESRIEFNIPGSGLHEITSNSYFPQIKNPVVIDGTTQAGYTTGSPVVKITGQMKTQCGFNVYNTTVTIKGLEISNFARSAIMLNECINAKIIDNKIYNISFSGGYGLHILSSKYTEIYGNRIEIDALPEYGRSSVGIYIDKCSYCTIGGTETGKANIIANCEKVGVVINSDKYNKVSGNSIYNNPNAIQLGSTANDIIQPPVINSYTNGILSGTALPNSTVEVFGSTGPDNANEYLVSVVVDGNGLWDVNISVNFDNLIATQTSTTLNTSQLSAPVFTDGSNSGISCQNAVLIKAGNYPRPILSNMSSTEKWFRFTPDSLSYVLFVDELSRDTINDVSSISLFKNSCDNLEEIFNSSIEDSLIIYADNLNIGEQYFIKVIAQDVTDDFFRLFCFHETKAEFDCPTDCSNLIANAEFTHHNPITDNSPFVSDVYCWHRGWGTPQLFILPANHARMHAYKSNSNYYSESIYTNVDILNGKEYELKFDFAEWKPETNSPSLKKFYIVLTLANDPFSSYNDGSAGVITHMPNNPQIFQIYDDNPTTTGVVENLITTDWQNKSIIFTSNRNYDLMYIYPESDLGQDYAAWLKIDNLSLSITNQQLIVVNSIVLCNDINSYTINSPTPLSGTWFSETNDISESGSISPSELSVGTHNFYYFTDDCSKKYQIPVIIRDLPEINSFNPTEFCINANSQQVVANPSGGIFTGAGISTNGMYSPSTVGIGDHTILYTYNDGFCTNTELFSIEVNNIPDQPIISATNYGYGCPGGSVILMVTEPVGLGFSYVWNGPDIPANTSGISATITNFGNNSIGFYSVIVTDNNNCSNSSQMQIKKFPEFVINPGPDGDCEGENTVYIETPVGFSSVITVTNLISTVTYFTGTYAYQPGGNTINIPYLAPGGYRIRHFFTTNGTDIICSTSQVVLIHPNPSAEISGVESICGAEATLFASGGTSYLWSNGDTESEATVYTSGTYYVTVFNNFNCFDVAEFTIELINEAAEIEVVYLNNDPCSHQVQFRISPGGDFNVTITNANTNTIVSSTGTWFGVSPTYLFPLSHPYNLPPGNYYLDLYSLNTPCVYHHYFNIPTVCPILISSANPGTCFSPYNGNVQVTISNGIPPYQIVIVQESDIVSNTYSFNESGTYTLTFNSNFNPELPYDIYLTNADPFGANYYFNQNAIGYSWPTENIIRLSDLSEATVFENEVICIDDGMSFTQYLFQDLTFDNCKVYTNTSGREDVYNTIWWIMPNNTTNIPAKLKIIDGTTIESGCPDKMWQGIEARAEHGISFYLETMFIEIKDSKISDAMIAIKLQGYSHIYAKNSIFENNVIDISINQIGNHYIPHTYIINNLFKTTGLLKDPYLFPKTHVYLSWSKDITFSNNHFENTLLYIPLMPSDVMYTTNKRGIGIEANFSSFTVTQPNHTYPAFTPLWTNSFEGLYYGIIAKGQNTYAPRIYHNNFKNNFRGVYMRDVNGARLLFNDFETAKYNLSFDYIGISINAGLPATNVSYAAYIANCNNFKIEENSIKNGEAGLYVYNTGEAAGLEVYKNSFGDGDNPSNFNMKAGTIVIGKNSDYINGIPSSGNIGLQTRCNTYNSTENAISVINGNMRKNQGAQGGQTNELAGNQFNFVSSPAMDFKVQIQTGNLSSWNFSQFDLGRYNYWQHENDESLDFYTQLDNFSELKVNDYTIEGEPYDVLSCPSHFPGPIAIDAELELSTASALRSTATGKENQYDDLVDRGDTEYLINLTESMSNRNFNSIFPILSNDGYLSDIVFEALLDNRSTNRPRIATVLISNSPLPDNIMEMVENSAYLKNGHKKQIRKVQVGTSPRLIFEYEIADIKQDISKIESNLINHAIDNDSVPAIRETVINYLINNAEINSINYVNRFNLQLAQTDIIEAKNTLDDLRFYATSLQNANIATEIERYCDVHDIYISLLQDTVYDKALLVQNQEFLREAALDFSPLYSGKAQTLYEMATDSTFIEYTPLPFEEILPRSVIIEQEDDIFMADLNIYPNPTRDKLYIEYNFQSYSEEGNEELLEILGYKEKENCISGEIKIYTIDGKLIISKSLEQPSGIEGVDMQNYPPASYIIKITDCYGFTKELKFVKQ